MAAETLLQQLQEALAAEKLSKAEEVQAVEREMQARLESSAIRWRNELEQHEVFWSSELAAEQQRHEIIEAGLEAEVISLKFEAEDWKLKEGAEMACKDQAESSIVSLQLLCGEQKVQLHHLHAEAKAAADAENATSRLEMSLAEGERLRKEAFDLRVTLTALTDRCKRQEQALARLRNSSARSNLPRPPLAGRREGALRGLASSIGCKESMAQEACLKTVQEDDNHLQTWSMSEASLAPDAFAAAHNLQQETSGGFESPASSVLPDAFAAAHNLQQETSGGFESPASSVLPDGFAVARGDLFPRDPSIASLSEASSLLDPFTVVRGPGIELNTFLAATILSLLLGHAMLWVHRWYCPDDGGSVSPTTCSRPDRHRLRILGLAQVICILLTVLSWQLEVVDVAFGGLVGTFLKVTDQPTSKTYSIMGLLSRLGKQGSTYLQVTFAVFVLIIPLLYLLAMAFLCLYQLQPKKQQLVLRLCYTLNAWAAYDVFFIAFLAAVLGGERYGIGQFIELVVYQQNLAPMCDALRDIGVQCMHVQLALLPGAQLILLAVVASFLVSLLATRKLNKG